MPSKKLKRIWERKKATTSKEGIGKREREREREREIRGGMIIKTELALFPSYLPVLKNKFR